MTYLDANGKKHAELIEIKPASQTKSELARKRGDQQQVAINYANGKLLHVGLQRVVCVFVF